MSSFILCPSPSAPQAPPSSPALHLLPFSLHPLPQSTTPLSHYFVPRTAPEQYPGGIRAGTPLATFRGRQIVGQELEVPKGYRGIVLCAAPTPSAGTSASLGGTSSRAGSSGLPLTPVSSFASSVASSSSTQDGEYPKPSSESPRAQRLAARVKGSGQVALARPRTKVTSAPKRRFKVDSDEEDSDGDASYKVVAPRPSKRRMMTATPEPAPDLPAINVVHATPVKAEIKNATESEDSDAVNAMMPVPEPHVLALEQPPMPLLPSPPRPQRRIYNVEVVDVDSTNNISDDSTRTDGRAPRLLVPTASFTSFTLWTPDVPLAGFSATELDEKTEQGTSATEAENIDDAKNDVAADEGGGVALERGWWRTGGAGDGGDEFVRALGEWLGIGEVIHEPVYSLDCDDDDDE